MKRLLLFLSLAICVLMSACSKLNEVSVSGKNFDDEVQLTQNLTFTFNKNLVPEGELNSWSSLRYVEISPKIEGVFKWTAPNELVFSPATAFEPATEYRAELSKNLLNKVEDKGYRVSGEVMNFHTPYLKLISTETYWTKSREDGKPLAKVKINFNYPVNVGEVASLLKVKDNDEKEIAFGIGQTGTQAAVPVALKGIADTDGKSVSLLIDKGVSVPSSKFESKDPIETKVSLPDPKTLEIVNVSTGFDNNEGYIKVTTNQELKADGLSDYYKVEINGNSNEPTPESAVIQYDSLGNPITVENTKKTLDKHSPTLQTKAELIENGFIVRGDFNETDNYVLTINNHTKGVLGASLSDDFTKDLYFGAMPASIGFANKKAVYLSMKGNRNVAVNIVNVEKVNVKISKVYENNILQFLRNNRYQDYDYSEDGEGSSGSSKAYTYYDDDAGVMSDVLVKKTIETQDLPQVRGVSALNLSMPDQNNLKGIYVVSINSSEQYYLNDTKLVAISDIGLITKQSEDALWVFANSIQNTDALSGIEVSLISSNNQVIQKIKTDGKGVAVFKDLKKNLGGFKVAMLTAHKDEDFNYLFLEDTQVETSRFEVEGKRNNASGFDAFIYGDRDIYRPGETVYLNTIVRKQNWESVGEIPLKIRLLMPNGKELKSFRKTTNAQGAVDLAIPTDRSNVTGTYIVEVLNGNDVLLASRNVSIEEFMPDRIKVDVKTGKEFYRNGESVDINATALNLFGPPASNRNYEMEFKLARKLFEHKGYEEYVFDIEDNTNFESIVRQGTTNDNGIAAEQFQIPATYTDMGVLEAKAYVTVFDETGRPVNRLKRLDVFTQSIFYGIGMPDTYISTNVPVQIPLVALNKDGKPINAKGRVEIVRFDYQTVIEKNPDNSLKYSSKKQTKVVYTRSIDFVNGKAVVSYAPAVSGEYEVRVHREGSKSWTAQGFYAYGYGYTSNTSFEVNNEGQVLMEFDKEKYEVGDRAKVLFKTPFKGKLLVTIERNNVLEHHYIETDKKSAELSFKVGNEHLPNVYVSATLIRAMDNSNLPLTVAHGYAPVMVEDPDTKLPVEIVAVEHSRSKTKQRVTIKTKANTELTIAVVDEGILQLKNFKTPNPHEYFYQKRALEVNSYDLYPFLFPELSISQHSSIGGDGYNLEKRVNPLTNGRTNLVAFWSGIVKTGFGGETTFEFDIPQFSGDLRIMAVAYKGEAFGSANKNMKVADPLVISTALPRFASPNDELIVPVNITNTTKQNASVSASISTTGSLQNLDAKPQVIAVGAGREGRVNFRIKAMPTMGLGKVVVTVNGLKEKFTESIDLTIRPSTSLLKKAVSGMVYAGQNASIPLATDFIPSSVKSQILLSKSPMVQFTQNFQDLLGYPHGCVEQTVSRAFPQLYFQDFVKLIQTGKKPYTKTGENELNPHYNVEEAIRKLETMQLPNGSMSYWAGSDMETWWGSAYTCHFLLESQKNDYAINTNTLGKLIEYLNNKVNKQEVEQAGYTDVNGSYISQSIAKREAIYSLYVLSLAGKPNRSVMNYYKANTQLLSQDEKYLLACAFGLLGDTRSYTALLPKVYGQDTSDRQTGGSFSSPVRNMALALNTLIETDPNNLQIPVLARQLSETMKQQSWLSTQESAFSFVALGKLAKKASQTNLTATLYGNGKAIGNFTGADLLVMKGIVANNSLATKGKGQLYYFAQTEGLSATGKFEEIDNVLRVRKTFMTRSGNTISGNNFRQNDLVVVKISVSSTTGLNVDNVVVTDMLPAGFEIENPRLSADRDLTWIKDQATPDHFDIRDDRINFFTNVSNATKNFYYLVRVVSKGKFLMGPASADAMYNGEYRSYSGGGTVNVE
jgi:alpha-2-macroglobulin